MTIDQLNKLPPVSSLLQALSIAFDAGASYGIATHKDFVQIHEDRETVCSAIHRAMSYIDCNSVESASTIKNSAEQLAKNKWNAEADKYNSWDSLSQDEKDELIAIRSNIKSKEGKLGMSANKGAGMVDTVEARLWLESYKAYIIQLAKELKSVDDASAFAAIYRLRCKLWYEQEDFAYVQN